MPGQAELYAVIRRCANPRADMARFEAVADILEAHPGTELAPCIALVGSNQVPAVVDFPELRINYSPELRDTLEAVGVEIAVGKDAFVAVVRREREQDEEITRRVAALAQLMRDYPDFEAEIKAIGAARRTESRVTSRADQLASMPYAEYLATDEWQDRRKRKLEAVGYACQICNAKGVRLDVHHRTYARRGRETDDDLTVLCHDCHEIFHQAGRLA